MYETCVRAGHVYREANRTSKYNIFTSSVYSYYIIETLCR